MWWRRVRYLLLLLLLCSIATCPTAKRSCTAQARAREAEEMLDYLANRVEASLRATGRVPVEPAGPTPAASCCEQGGRCAADPALWDTSAWKALAFSVDGDFRYTYAYVPDPSGTSAVVRATGDTDCDGTLAVYEIAIERSPTEPTEVTHTWTRTNPYE